jgi:hypothetical protein
VGLTIDTDGLEDELGPIPEKECVLVEHLAPVIQRELARRTREWANQNGSQEARATVGQLSPQTLLCLESGVKERRLFSILRRGQVYVDLTIADNLLMALDMNLSIHLPTEAIVSKKEGRRRTEADTLRLLEIAQKRGDQVPPPGSKERRCWPEQYRRRLVAEAA